MSATEEATKAVCTSEAAQTAAVRTLAEAKTRAEIGAARVETTRQELATAHAHLANEPGAAASKRAAAARTAVDDAIAVEGILREAVGRAELAAEVVAAGVKGAHAALAKAERDVDMAEGGRILQDLLDLSAQIRARRARLDELVARHSRVMTVDSFGVAAAEVRNDMRIAAGLPPNRLDGRCDRGEARAGGRIAASQSRCRTTSRHRRPRNTGATKRIAWKAPSIFRGPW